MIKKTHKKEKFNWEQTLIKNLPFLLIAFPVFVYIFMSLDSIKTIQDEQLKTMAIIFYMFTSLQVLRWLGSPKIVCDIIEETEYDTSNIRPADKVNDIGFNGYGAWMCKNTPFTPYIGLGLMCNEKNIVTILNHEVIHLLLDMFFDRETTTKLDNICPDGDLINNIFYGGVLPA